MTINRQAHRRAVAGLVALITLVAAGCFPQGGDGPTTTTTTAATTTAPTTTTTTTTTSTTTTTAVPVACAIGFSSATGNEPCTPAPAGSYVDTPGALAPTLCALGTYQPGTGAASCLLAPNGFYVDSTGATAATPCGVGQVTAGLGSASAAACVTPSFVFANTVFSAFAWGSINGSGLQPGAQVFFCADQVPSCFLTGFVPAANGTLVSSFIFSLQVDCYTNGYFRTKNVAGTTLDSNKVNAPPQASCAAAN